MFSWLVSGHCSVVLRHVTVKDMLLKHKASTDAPVSRDSSEGTRGNTASLVLGSLSFETALRTKSSAADYLNGGVVMPQLSLYHAEASPPCRTVRMLAHTIGLDLQLVDVDMLQEEHRKPKFVKMNPQHQVPVLDDNGFYLSESRAIIGYLVDNYAEDDSLYPRDPKRRATVNRMLFFDAGTLWMSYSDYQMPIFYGQPGDPEKEKKMMAAFETFDKLLDGKEWATGSHVTIADYALAVTTSSAEWSGVDLKAYSNVCRWLDRVKKAIPCFDEINNSSFAALKELLQKLTEKLAQMSVNKQ